MASYGTLETDSHVSQFFFLLTNDGGGLHEMARQCFSFSRECATFSFYWYPKPSYIHGKGESHESHFADAGEMKDSTKGYNSFFVNP